MIPFGPRKVLGIVWEESADAGEFKVKKVHEVVDESPLVTEPLRGLASFMRDYYCHPLGDVLKTMLPAIEKKKKKTYVELTAKGEEVLAGPSSPQSDALLDIFKKRRRLTLATYKTKVKEIDPLLLKGCVRHVVERSTDALRITAEVTSPSELEPEQARALTEEQDTAFQVIVTGMTNSERRKPYLLKGITGSGKTEVYLHVIQKALELDGEAQALVLVPEISLTPQMTRVFTNRFGGQVVVTHSGLSHEKRWECLYKMARGEAKVLIGPRSALFAPFKNLRVILVDEEHDGSYKQSSGLSYNARDMAVFRAKLEDAVVVLGSATPSLESYHNAKVGKYHLLVLAERVHGRPLPLVELLEVSPGRFGSRLDPSGDVARVEGLDLPIHADIFRSLRENLENGMQSIVLVNRRGYSYFLFDQRKREAVVCENCSISFTLHRRNQELRCHYCGLRKPVSAVIKASPRGFLAVGYGSQQAERYLQQELPPSARIERVDAASVNHKSLPEILERFRRGDIDILVGTQMLAKGHDYPKVTLTVILEIDQLLNLPDFRAGERTFQLMVQAAGRAGRDQMPGGVLVQSCRGDHPVVLSGMKQDYDLFANQELEFRRSLGYPPFTRMVSFELSSPKESEVQALSTRMSQWLHRKFAGSQALQQRVQVLGPTVPGLEVLRGRFRRSVVFFSSDLLLMKELVRDFYDQHKSQPSHLRMTIDVDPQGNY